MSLVEALRRLLWPIDKILWDAQIRRDFSPGGAGMELLRDVERQIAQGDFRPMEDGPFRSPSESVQSA